MGLNCKEICSIANGATKKEIGKAKEFIVKQLQVEMDTANEVTAEKCFSRTATHFLLTRSNTRTAASSLPENT
ncbi:Transcription initiation factor IIB [Acorus calamus]|uniref:Transcription initiation factor IIB n=1 Tax=Acorus calamus TaxID=4465 RepID=A0AAV9FST3_ACOCL|nr:Transcription initiation factor IIB [Acorus calamus]